MPDPSIEELLKQQHEILQKLDSSEPRKKDLWDKVSTLSTVVSGVLLAAVGLFFTSAFNERSIEQSEILKDKEHKILQAQTVGTFIPHLIVGEDNEQEKQIALIAITALGNEDIAAQLTELLSPSEGVRSAGDRIMAAAPAREQRTVPISRVSRTVPTDSAAYSKTGWAYLGDFESDEADWKTRYFEELNGVVPAEGTVLTVRAQTGALNVRKDIPSTFGRMAPVVDVLRPGSKVTVMEVKPWRTSGYMWAKVQYSDS